MIDTLTLDTVRETHTGPGDWFCPDCLTYSPALNLRGRCPVCDSDAVFTPTESAKP